MRNRPSKFKHVDVSSQNGKCSYMRGTGRTSTRLLHSVNRSPIVMKMPRMLSHDFTHCERIYTCWSFDSTCWSFDSEYEINSPDRSSFSERHRVSDHQWRATLLTKSAPHAWLPLWPDPVHPVSSSANATIGIAFCCSNKLSVVFAKR